MKNGHVFEAFQAISEAPIQVCQICQEPVEKLVSSSSFQLKGTGWYVTDYKKQDNTSPKVGNTKAKVAEQTSLASTSDQTSTSSGTTKEATEKKLEPK